MEDIQDGIKVSIQDGVTEDPATIDPQILAHKSYGAVNYILTEMSNPEIESEVRGETGLQTSAVISCSVSGVVT